MPGCVRAPNGTEEDRTVPAVQAPPTGWAAQWRLGRLGLSQALCTAHPTGRAPRHDIHPFIPPPRILPHSPSWLLHSPAQFLSLPHVLVKWMDEKMRPDERWGPLSSLGRSRGFLHGTSPGSSRGCAQDRVPIHAAGPAGLTGEGRHQTRPREHTWPLTWLAGTRSRSRPSRASGRSSSSCRR